MQRSTTLPPVALQTRKSRRVPIVRRHYSFHGCGAPTWLIAPLQDWAAHSSKIKPPGQRRSAPHTHPPQPPHTCPTDQASVHMPQTCTPQQVPLSFQDRAASRIPTIAAWAPRNTTNLTCTYVVGLSVGKHAYTMRSPSCHVRWTLTI